MDETRFRPLGVGEILDAAFTIYRNHFKTLWLCVLVVVVPLAIIDTLITASVTENAFDPTEEPTATSDGAAIGGGLARIILGFILALLSAAACTRAVGAAYLGNRVTWQESLGYALRKLFPLIVLSILTGVAVIFGLVLVIVGAVFIGVRLSVGSPALLIDDIGPVAAFRRSWNLVGGRWWATFAVLLLSTLLVLFISLVINLLLVGPLLATDPNELVGATLTTIGTIVSNVFTVPLQAAVVAILYFDLRVRKEGLDIQLLAESVGSGTAPADVARSSGLGYDSGPAETGGQGGFAPPTPGGFSAPTGGDPLRPPEERDPS